MSKLENINDQRIKFPEKSMEIVEEGYRFIRDDAIGDMLIKDLENEAIKRTLKFFNNNRRKTAKSLGMSERTLYRKIEELDIEPKIKVETEVHKIIIFLNFLSLSCGFYSMAGSIPPHIKSIAIPLMDNQTAEFDLENITDVIIEEFNEAGILYITDEKNAHSILKGTIKRFLKDLTHKKRRQYLNTIKLK